MNILSSMLKYLIDKVGNTTLGTTATTVTGAIAEHEGDITTINRTLNNLDIQVVSVSIGEQTINSNSVVVGTFDVSDSIPSGYTAILATPRSTSSYAFQYYSCWLASSTSVYVQIIRRTGTATTITPTVMLLCVKGF